MNKIYSWIGLGVALVVLPFMALYGAGDLEDLHGLSLNNAKLPLYNKQTLTSMVFCGSAERQGKLVVGKGVVLDLIQREADVDEIRDGWGLKLYPLDAKLLEVFNFWRVRLYSEGVMTTSNADIDQETRKVFGDKPVFFRSPVLDLDGLGFEADFSTRSILVKSEVHIVLRMGGCDPRRLVKGGSKLPDKYEFLTATSDSMLIDLENNQVMLIGEVRVDEESSEISCDRMTIFLDHHSEGKSEDKPAEYADIEESLSGVSRILCDGNVVISRKLTEAERQDGEQRAYADHLVYDVPVEVATLTCDQGRYPRIVHGRDSMVGKRITMLRNEQAVTFTGNCEIHSFEQPENPGDPETEIIVTSDLARMNLKDNVGEFTGNVHIDESRMVLDCGKMRILLQEEAVASKPEDSAKKELKSAVKSESFSAFPGLGSSSGRRELDRIFCSERVKMVRKDETGKLDPTQTGESEHADVDTVKRTVRMYGGQPRLVRGNEEISARELLIWTDQQRLQAKEESRIVLRDATVSGNASAPLQLGSKVGTANTPMAENASTLENTSRPENTSTLGNTSSLENTATIENTSSLARTSNLGNTSKVGNTSSLANTSNLENIATASSVVAKEPLETIIDSDETDLDYGGGKLIFIGNVRVTDPRMLLDCDRMDLTLEPRELVASTGKSEPATKKGSVMSKSHTKKKSSAKSKSSTAKKDSELQRDSKRKDEELLGNSEDKFLSKAVCSGSVHVSEQRFNMRTDELVLLFRELSPGTIPEPGMFQSNDTQLTMVFCNGNVLMRSIPDSGEKKTKSPQESGVLGNMLSSSDGGVRTMIADNAMMNLIKYESEFHDSVKLSDEQSTLTCKDMFVYAVKSATDPKGDKSSGGNASPMKLPLDADPFAIEDSSAVPERIVLTEGLELSRILCLNDVVLTRMSKNGEPQCAGGQMADYVVADKRIVLTGDEEQKPWMSAPGGRLTGQEVIVRTDTESMDLIGGALLDLDMSSKSR